MVALFDVHFDVNVIVCMSRTSYHYVGETERPREGRRDSTSTKNARVDSVNAERSNYDAVKRQ